MPVFTVKIPFTEKELGKEKKRHKKEMAIEAEGPLEAMQKAMEHFRDKGDNPYVSWSVVVESEKIQAVEIESGQKFQLTQEGSDVAQDDSEELPSFNEAIFNVESRERLEVLEKALECTRNASDGIAAASCLLALTQEATGSEAGALVLYDPKQDDLYFAAAVGPRADKVMDYRIPCGKGFVGYCFDTGQVVAITHAQKDERFYRKLAEDLRFMTHSILAVPIYWKNHIYGVLELINKTTDDVYTGNDILIAKCLGNFLAVVLKAFEAK